MIFALGNQKVFLVNYKNMGLCLYIYNTNINFAFRTEWAQYFHFFNLQPLEQHISVSRGQSYKDFYT